MSSRSRGSRGSFVARDPQPLWVGVDLGTSWAKAAAWAPDGQRVAESMVPMPPVEEGVQDARGVRAAGEQAIRALAVRSPFELAFTTQRDTVLLTDVDDNPVSPLLTWRVRGDLDDPERRARRLASWGLADEPRAGVRHHQHRTLEAWLAEVWRARAGMGMGIPGLLAAPLRITHAGGDKNCEYRALGVGPSAPGVAGLSLGSAIAMGLAIAKGDNRLALPEPPSPSPPPLPAGVVRSPGVGGAGEPVWHLETGILSGMGGLDLALSALGLPAWEGPLPLGPADDDGRGPRVGDGTLRLCLIPHFGGALDDLEARGRLLVWRDSDPDGRAGLEDAVDLLTGPAMHAPAGDAPAGDAPAATGLEAGADAGVDADSVARAWISGVVAELVRLRPNLEQAAGQAITELRVAGGGVRAAGDWGSRLAQAFGIPVRMHEDPWLGCRGAILAAGARTLEPIRHDLYGEAS
jgi:hypothetical protein